MGNVLDLAEVVAQDVDHVAPAHAALAASWFSLVTDGENLINHYGYPDQLADDRKYTDEDEDGLDLEGRFCINP